MNSRPIRNTRKQLTPTHVQQRLIKIGNLARQGKHEEAHREEQALHYECLVAIRDGHPEPRIMAELALKTTLLELRRWSA